MLASIRAGEIEVWLAPVSSFSAFDLRKDPQRSCDRFSILPHQGIFKRGAFHAGFVDSY
jgi:hypothetical protein